LETDGSGLQVPDFLTTLVVNTGNALRRRITLVYAKQFGLSIAEWRVLSVVAHARQMMFSQLVIAAATDKGSLSRMLRNLQGRGLLTIRSEGAGSQKKVTCAVSPAGAKIYRQVMPIARRRQAEMLLQLSLQERRSLYRALRKLRELCGPEGEDAEDD
jgi:DNA-binding MarR family transcriptional regulator